MVNPYTSSFAPSNFDGQQNVQPVMQNTQGQNAYNQQMFSQNAQFAQPNATPHPTAISLANALRDMGKVPNQNANQQNAPFGSGISPYLPWNQMSTSNKYGTNPYSQQSVMLAQQDKGM